MTSIQPLTIPPYEISPTKSYCFLIVLGPIFLAVALLIGATWINLL